MRRWRGLDYATAFVRARRELGLANAITDPCPKCHRQRRKDGTCTHCERQELLDGGLKRISVNQAKAVLSEPVVVKNPTGIALRFTKDKLLSDTGHLRQDHTPQDFDRRARVLLYGIDAAKTSRNIRNGSATTPNALGVYAQRKEIRKQYRDKASGRLFNVVVVADNAGTVYDVFNLYPDIKKEGRNY